MCLLDVVVEHFFAYKVSFTKLTAQEIMTKDSSGMDLRRLSDDRTDMWSSWMFLTPVSVEPVGITVTFEAHPTGLLHMCATEPVVRVLCYHMVSTDPEVFEDLVATGALPLAHAVRRAPISTFAEATTWLSSPSAEPLKLVHCRCELSHLVLISSIPQATVLRTEAIPLLLNASVDLIGWVIVRFKLRFHVLCKLIEGNIGP